MHTNEMSANGHETKGQMASRNLGLQVAGLDEMRWMMVAALGEKTMPMAAFDEGVELLRLVLDATRK